LHNFASIFFEPQAKKSAVRKADSITPPEQPNSAAAPE